MSTHAQYLLDFILDAALVGWDVCLWLRNKRLYPLGFTGFSLSVFLDFKLCGKPTCGKSLFRLVLGQSSQELFPQDFFKLNQSESWFLTQQFCPGFNQRRWKPAPVSRALCPLTYDQGTSRGSFLRLFFLLLFYATKKEVPFFLRATGGLDELFWDVGVFFQTRFPLQACSGKEEGRQVSPCFDT